MGEYIDRIALLVPETFSVLFLISEMWSYVVCATCVCLGLIVCCFFLLLLVQSWRGVFPLASEGSASAKDGSLTLFRVCVRRAVGLQQVFFARELRLVVAIVARVALPL